MPMLRAAILTVISGAQVVVLQPGVVQGLVEQRQFSPQQAGYILSIEMWGFAVTTIAMIWLVSRFDWHLMLRCALGLIIFANLGSIGLENETAFTGSRFLAGLGSGVVVSLGFATIGRLPHPDRNYGIMVACVLTYGAVALQALPSLFRMAGFSGLTVWLAIFAGVALLFSRALPRTNVAAVPEGVGQNLSGHAQYFALAAMLFYFIAQGAAWSYMALVGKAADLTPEDISTALAVSQFPGIAGAIFAAFLGNRFGSLPPLLFGISSGIIALLALLTNFTAGVFLLLVGLFNFAWNLTHPYLLGFMARLDPYGRVVVRATAMQKIGLAIGPLAAAGVISSDEFSNAIWLASAALALSLALMIAALSLAHSEK